jgi:esterase
MSPLKLYYREMGQKDRPVMLLLHGLFGNSGNWAGVVKYLQNEFRLILPDMRNHGRSPHSEEMNFPAMAADLKHLMSQLKLTSATILGHSMGAKAAMWLALNEPEWVDRLVVADMAPVAYHNRFVQIFEGMSSMPLETLSGRDDADRYLAEYVPLKLVRQYLLQNLVKQDGAWRWRCNLAVLQRQIMVLAGYPSLDNRVFAGDVLFVYGERSDYVLPDYRPIIDRHFPHARLRMLNEAGHWLYAEQPEAFSRAVRQFLGNL